MHQLGRFIQDLMDAEQMTQADLMRRSKLSRQHVSTLVTDGGMSRWPQPETFHALAMAFPAVGELPFILKAAESLGFPIDDLATVEPDYSKLSNDSLLRILADRLEGGQSGWVDAGGSEETEQTPADETGSVTSLPTRDEPNERKPTPRRAAQQRKYPKGPQLD